MKIKKDPVQCVQRMYKLIEVENGTAATVNLTGGRTKQHA